MKLVFVSSPYSSIKCKERDREYYARKLALEACRVVRVNGYEPISPVLAFMGVYSELEREKIMDACFELLNECEYYYFFPSEFSDTSKGMLAEKEEALKNNKKILKFSLFE